MVATGSRWRGHGSSPKGEPKAVAARGDGV
uniref:Uncharacterized protein n=1 Tax=Arundo donax TaxID=35708 RepID=A0A0A9AZC2_ARUDO